jgi:hypothetical protein
MKNKKYHTVGTVPKSRTKFVETDKIPLAHRYMTAHFPVLLYVLQ